MHSTTGSSQRVLAWWDMDVRIGAFHKRKVTARPLKDLERVLGHRLHVESWERYEHLPDGVWQLHAYHYLDTADTRLAAYTTLLQLLAVSDWTGTSWLGFNASAATQTDNCDDATICALYWAPPHQIGLPRYVSSGVQLELVDWPDKTYDRHGRIADRIRLARPVVRVPPPPQQRSDYEIEFTVHIVCGNKQDLMTFHWPRFQAAYWPQGVDHFEVDARTHAGKPNIIRVRRTLRELREHEAVAHCLTVCRSFRVKLERETEFRFLGERNPCREPTDGIVEVVMRRLGA